MSARCSHDCSDHSHVGLREQLRDPTPGKGASGVKGSGAHACLGKLLYFAAIVKQSEPSSHEGHCKGLAFLGKPACLATGNRVGKRHWGRRN